MKKFVKSILILSLRMGMLTSCVIKQPSGETETPKTITVTGHGSVTVKPDLIYLQFLVRTTDWNVQRAVEKNATNTNNVLTGLGTAGVASSDISTFDYEISQDNSNNYPGQYTVKNTIAVVIRNIDTAGAIIDSAVKQNVGANGITEFRYEVSDTSSQLRQARTLAIQDAQDSASLLAGASGCKISAVQNISEYHSTPMRSVSNAMMMKAADGIATQLAAGTVTIESNVTITYTLEN